MRKRKFFPISLKQEVRSLNKPSFYAGTAPAGLFFAAQVPMRYLVAGLCPAPRAHWELDRGATRPCKPSYKHPCPTIRQSAPAGVSQACGLAMPKPAPGQGTTPSATQAAPNRPSFPQNFSRCARKPGRCPVPARQRGSRGLNVPSHPTQSHFVRLCGDPGSAPSLTLSF